MTEYGELLHDFFKNGPWFPSRHTRLSPPRTSIGCGCCHRNTARTVALEAGRNRTYGKNQFFFSYYCVLYYLLHSVERTVLYEKQFGED